MGRRERLQLALYVAVVAPRWELIRELRAARSDRSVPARVGDDAMAGPPTGP
ncbi:hypothetical protein [Streptomyces sp. XD-27]|uniref:hypothetical protein n=1 Tax=Streptomyces sp. XD-27 TaxID=3062779 RepID=UPI0026F45E54|nr:hypothetical protein [Streptomyces sp. XD-27]WKX69452.1 hypothetical protein Q3Y56_05570 [Streptomyces sp. XD-27]